MVFTVLNTWAQPGTAKQFAQPIPGEKYGVPVPVLATIEVHFRLM
jgi:hypothetical protein